jgi:hypothetical protein
MMDGRYNPQRAGLYNYNYDDRYYHSEDEEEFADSYNTSNHHFDPRSSRPEAYHPEEVEREQGKEKEKKETMSSWLGRVSTSSQAQFAATALVSGAVVAGAIFGYQAVRRQERVKDLKSGIPDTGGDKVGFVLSLFCGWRGCFLACGRGGKEGGKRGGGGGARRLVRIHG